MICEVSWCDGNFLCNFVMSSTPYSRPIRCLAGLKRICYIPIIASSHRFYLNPGRMAVPSRIIPLGPRNSKIVKSSEDIGMNHLQNYRRRSNWKVNRNLFQQAMMSPFANACANAWSGWAWCRCTKSSSYCKEPIVVSVFVIIIVIVIIIIIIVFV